MAAGREGRPGQPFEEMKEGPNLDEQKQAEKQAAIKRRARRLSGKKDEYAPATSRVDRVRGAQAEEEADARGPAGAEGCGIKEEGTSKIRASGARRASARRAARRTHAPLARLSTRRSS